MAPRPLAVLRLLRVGTLFSPAADVVASACVLGLPWSADLVRAIGASVAVYAAGMVWNDIADRHVDAVRRPERPLPRGDVSLPFAVLLGIALLALAIGLSPCRGHHTLLAGLVLVYDFGNKHLGWLAAPLMGSLRALNLYTAAAIAPASAPGASTDLLLAAVCYGVYVMAVTVLGVFEDQPHVRPRAVAAVQTAPPLAALTALLAVQGGPWPAPALFALPALLFLRRNSRMREWSPASMRRSMTWLLLGTMLFTAALALARDRVIEALGIVATIAPARWIARRISMT